MEMFLQTPSVYSMYLSIVLFPYYYKLKVMYNTLQLYTTDKKLLLKQLVSIKKCIHGPPFK